MLGCHRGDSGGPGVLPVVAVEGVLVSWKKEGQEDGRQGSLVQHEGSVVLSRRQHLEGGELAGGGCSPSLGVLAWEARVGSLWDFGGGQVLT